jgi:MarR family transcriptional regulator, organic hydroperoxide resistance regulator
MLDDRLLQAARSVQRAAMRALESFGLNLDELHMLERLNANERQSIGGVARSLSLHFPHASKIADRLEDKLLLRRIPAEEDTRRVYLLLTPQGERLRNTARSEVQKAMRAFSEKLGQWDEDRLVKLLGKLIAG